MTKKNILELVVLFIVIFGGAFGAITYFAKAGDLELVDMRLEQKIVNDSIYDLQRQMWQLEDKYGTDNCSAWRDDKDRNRYRELKLQLEALKKRQTILMQQQTKKQ